MIVWAFCAVAAGKSATIVYINGAKYYIHTVQAGETLYGLSKTYGVGEKVILENNPSIVRGLKTAENIKILFVADVPEPKSDKKLRVEGRDALRHFAAVRDSGENPSGGQPEP